MSTAAQRLTLSGVAGAAVLLAIPPPYELPTLLGSLLLLAVMLHIGFLAAAASGIDCFGSTSAKTQRNRAVISFVAGFALGLFLLLTLRFVVARFEPRILERLARDAAVPLWKWAIILFHAPVLEELMFRLFALSIAVWALSRLPVLKTSQGHAARGVPVIANVLSSLAFAALHLPAWYQAGEVGPGLLASVVILNVLPGYVMGHIYLRFGIQFAILAHFGGDLGLHIVGRALP